MIKALMTMVAFAATVNANCDNSCSGHGSCNMDDVCSCYDNWGVGLSMDSGDCSDRICPYEIAWVDTPNGQGKFHRYAECAGRGICNRGNGLCECFEGYEGEACHRTTCPNLCSGHGTCEYIEDLVYGAVWTDYDPDDLKSDAMNFNGMYNWWDRTKTRGCKCDAQYADVDCSKRLCPYGTDVLADDEALTNDQQYHKQQINLNPENRGFDSVKGKTFALTFVSKLNETFTTVPIVFPDLTNAGTQSAELADFSNDVRLALLRLPNQIIDDCQVKVTVSGTGTNAEDNYIKVLVSFSGEAVRGPQHWLVVEDYECSAGCTPRITGLGLETAKVFSFYSPDSVFNNIDAIESQRSVFNSYECGRRGKCDYNSGLCQCFEGYTGESCQMLTTLV